MNATAELAETVDNLALALARVQANLPHVHKGKTANTGTFSYKYADLSDVAAAIHPLLAAEGLAFTAKPTMTEEFGFVLRYSLMHGPSGEADGGDYPLPDPTRTAPQQLGSAISYGRRYALCAVTGVVPDEDDDGAAANDTTSAPRRQRSQQKRAERGPVPAKENATWETSVPVAQPPDAQTPTAAAEKPADPSHVAQAWMGKVDAAANRTELLPLKAELLGLLRGDVIGEDQRDFYLSYWTARDDDLAAAKGNAA